MKSKTLQERLARSLDKVNTKEQKKQTAGRKPLAPPPADQRCSKISISLFNTDLERVKAIRAHVLAERGAAISTSQVIKLALRTAPLSAELCKALDQAKAEDGRKWQ